MRRAQLEEMHSNFESIASKANKQSAKDFDEQALLKMQVSLINQITTLVFGYNRKGHFSENVVGYKRKWKIWFRITVGHKRKGKIWSWIISP